MFPHDTRACDGSNLMSDLKNSRARWSVAIFVAIPDDKAEFVLATSERKRGTNRKDPAPTIALGLL